MNERQATVKVLQYGEGNFLRAFADWMIDIANERAGWNARVTIVKPRPGALPEAMRARPLSYGVVERGLEGDLPVERRREIHCVDAALNPEESFAAYAALARDPALRFVLSNTTEAGIRDDESDLFELRPPRSYPARLAQLLYLRAEAMNYAEDKGLIILPTELIDANGEKLRELVARHAARWRLGERFEAWLNDACVFADTLVDRIVTGRPSNAEKSIDVECEPFHFWAIAPKRIEAELPLREAGLNVAFADDIAPYRLRKLRLLNASHTLLTPVALLAGCETVLDATRDGETRAFLEAALWRELLPSLPPRDDLAPFARDVLRRFENPFSAHALRSISLNGVSKWRARCLPALKARRETTGELPARLTLSLAALMALYRSPFEAREEDAVLAFLRETRGASVRAFAERFLSEASFWGEDLRSIPRLTDETSASLETIEREGMRAALKRLS